jgi:hypothetical protein
MGKPSVFEDSTRCPVDVGHWLVEDRPRELSQGCEQLNFDHA